MALWLYNIYYSMDSTFLGLRLVFYILVLCNKIIFTKTDYNNKESYMLTKGGENQWPGRAYV